MLISLKEYAQMHGKDYDNLRKKVLSGGFKTAQRIGHFWAIDSEEPFTDCRVKSGKYQKKKGTDD